MKRLYLRIMLFVLIAFSLHLEAQEVTSLVSGTNKTSLSIEMSKRHLKAESKNNVHTPNIPLKTMTVKFKNGTRQEFRINEIESIEYFDDHNKDMFVAYLTNAGMLYTVLSKADAGDLIEMKLSGHIDARDFDYIKWYCNNIQVLDLKDVVIDAYTGEDGTNEGFYDAFHANEIPTGAFYYWGTSNKHNYTGIPKNVGMTSLKKIILPEGLCSIGEKAFANMEQLENVTVKTPYPPQAHNNCFQRLSKKAKLYVPKGTKSRYSSAEGWNEFSEIIEVNDNGDPIISDSPLIGTWRTTRIEGWGESVSTVGIDYLQLKADGTYLHVEEEDGVSNVTKGTWTTSKDKFTLYKKEGGRTIDSFEYEIVELTEDNLKISMWRVIAYMERVQDTVIKPYLKKGSF